MNWWPVYKKELRSYFSSPIAYVVFFLFLAIIGTWWYFWDFQQFLILSMSASRMPQYAQALNVNEVVIKTLFWNISLVMLFGIPLLTMRLFSEERKSGTYELLFTLPLRDWETLFGKFLACWTIFGVMVALTVIYPITLGFLTNPELLPILTGYLGMLLLGGAFISLGVFISSLTENQIIAAFATYGTLLVPLVLGMTSGVVGPVMAKVLEELNIYMHLTTFVDGVIDTKDVIYYLLFSYLFMFLTLRSLESRRWRG
jgi:ABC-2 type transport system permease protein